MNKSENVAAIAAALAKAQAEIRGAVADSVNPHFRSRYADLASVWDACRGPLTANGLSVAQFPEADGAKVTVTTLLMHSSGEWLTGSLTAMAEKAGAQAIGSTITYLRRYGLSSIAGIAPTDDDAEAAEGRGPPSASHKVAVEPPKMDFPARSGTEAGAAMKDALNKMRSSHGSKPTATSRKAAVMSYLSGRYGDDRNVRVALARIVGRTFPDDDEIRITMHELETLEAFVISEEASATEAPHV